jgi:acyl-CoA synthetase (NDP forming)
VTSAAFRQFGVTRVDGLDELLDTSAALARTRPANPPTWGPDGPGVCVYAVHDTARDTRRTAKGSRILFKLNRPAAS